MEVVTGDTASWLARVVAPRSSAVTVTQHKLFGSDEDDHVLAGRGPDSIERQPAEDRVHPATVCVDCAV